jgi:hypothetical protein
MSTFTTTNSTSRRRSHSGYTASRLDTGPHQPKAERIYRNAGYRPIHNFNDNPVAIFFGEKALS